MAELRLDDTNMTDLGIRKKHTVRTCSEATVTLTPPSVALPIRCNITHNAGVVASQVA